ncbi:MAG: arsenate reductase ArsC [Methanomassiliicoccales archaeon]
MIYRVLFICTHNSARSQIAEGITNALFPGRVEAHSAGTKPGMVHPMAIKVMAEIGVDISGNRSKHLDEFKNDKFDLAVTVCDGANEICPFFAGAKDHEHAGFPDPSAVEGTHEERLAAFRMAREDITRFVRTRFENV